MPKISEFPQSSTITEATLIPIVIGGVTKYITYGNLLKSGIPGPVVARGADTAANIEALTTMAAGDLWIVTTGGTIDSIDYTTGDMALYGGTAWYRIDNDADQKITGPASAVSGNVISFNGTTGKVAQDSGKAIADIVTGPASATGDNIVSYNGTTGKIIKDTGKSLSTITDNDRRFAVSAALTTTQTISDSTAYSIFPVTTSTSQIVITLPDATVVTRKLKFYKTDSAAGRFCFLTKTGQTINGVTANGTTYYPSTPSATVGGVGARYCGFCVQSDGANWIVTEIIMPVRKSYLVGQTYNGVSLGLTGSPAVSGTPRGTLIPYQTIDGKWWCDIALYWAVASGSRTGVTITIDGITFINSSPYYQPAVGMIDPVAGVTQCFCGFNSGVINLNYASATTTNHWVNIQAAELNTKPTWMD